MNPMFIKAFVNFVLLVEHLNLSTSQLNKGDEEYSQNVVALIKDLIFQQNKNQDKLKFIQDIEVIKMLIIP